MHLLVSCPASLFFVSEHSMDPQDDILQCWLDWKGMYDEVDYVIREISTKRKQGTHPTSWFYWLQKFKSTVAINRTQENQTEQLACIKCKWWEQCNKAASWVAACPLQEVKEEVRKLHLQRLKCPLSLSQDPRTAAMQQLEKMKMYQKENRQLGKPWYESIKNIWFMFFLFQQQSRYSDWITNPPYCLTSYQLFVKGHKHSVTVYLA